MLIEKLKNAMKKTIIATVLTMLAFTIKAQRAFFKNDTARYNGIAYVVGDTIKLDKGSQPDKSFAYITTGIASTELDKAFAKTEAVIEKIYVQRKTIYFNARLIDKTNTTAAVIKVSVDLEAAVDNKEIK